MKNLNKVAGIFFSLGLVFIVLGVSYAFFVYNKSGLYSYAINGGKMNVIYNETSGNNITLNNAYPLTNEEALTKALEFEFTVTGYNESKKNVYYAIEIAHGNNVEGKERFLDTDMKLSLFENSILIMRNQIFDNLDNQGIYYGYIASGTTEASPIINNYTIRLWINDGVLITNTPENINTEGKSVYSTSEFENSYANFKINIRANLTGEGIGNQMYDANGGEYTPKQTSLLTNRITTQKPVMANKGFLGWSEDREATVPEYKAGDYYSGNGKLLYAVYGDTRNVMGTFPTTITDQKANITEIYFINDTQENIDTRYDAATIKADLTYNSQGNVKGWLEVDPSDNTKYFLYVGSNGTTYLSTGNRLFCLFEEVITIDLTNVDSSMVTSMEGMFGYYYNDEINGIVYDDICFNLINIDVSGLNTSQVTNMSQMFDECISLINLDVSNFDTSSVTDMSRMFELCEGLMSLDVSKFDTSLVTNMLSMFDGCSSLTSLDVSNFDTSLVADMSWMFHDCHGLTNLDVSGLDTSSVTYMLGMFSNCSGLIDLDVSKFDTSLVTNMLSMFKSCSNLISLDLSNFDTSSVTDMSRMFELCEGLMSLDVSKFDTSLVTNMLSMFDSCSSLTSINVSNFDTSLVTNMSKMFYNCSSLISLDVNNFDTSLVTNMSKMFYDCSSLTILDVSNFDTPLVTDMSYMFRGCESLTNLNVSNLDTSSVRNISWIFFNCDSLTSLDVSNFDTSSVTDMSWMFSGCHGLTNLDVSGFDTSSVTTMYGTFSDCSNLLDLYLSNFDTSSVTTMYGMFWNCSTLTNLDLSNFATSSVTNMYGMFNNCSSMINLDLSNFTFNATLISLSLNYDDIFSNMPSTAIVTVNTAIEQSWILGLNQYDRPSAWNTTNVVIKS